MYFIVGDIGNTSTRICLIKKSKIKKSFIFDTKKFLNRVLLEDYLKNFQKLKLKKDCCFQVLCRSPLKKLKVI